MDIQKIKQEILNELSKGNNKPYKELRNLINWIYRNENPLKKKAWNRSYYEKIKNTTEPLKQIKNTTENKNIEIKNTTENIKKSTELNKGNIQNTTEFINPLN